MNAGKILVLGEMQGRDFTPLRLALESVTAGGRGSCRAMAFDRRRSLSAPFQEPGPPGEESVPDLCLVVQHWPDEFSPEDVFGLLNEFPLARLLCVFGPWCEADGRNRDVWPAGTRVSVAHCATRIEQELRAISGDSTAPLVPLTASRTEIFAAQIADPTVDLQGSRIYIDSPDGAWKQMLAAAIRDSGGTVTNDPLEATGVLFDVDPLTATRLQQRQSLVDRVPHVPIVQISSWLPDANDPAQDASTVISRLAPLQVLLAALQPRHPTTIGH